jgi:hypothetical protein
MPIAQRIHPASPKRLKEEEKKKKKKKKKNIAVGQNVKP